MVVRRQKGWAPRRTGWVSVAAWHRPWTSAQWRGYRNLPL